MNYSLNCQADSHDFEEVFRIPLATVTKVVKWCRLCGTLLKEQEDHESRSQTWDMRKPKLLRQAVEDNTRLTNHEAAMVMDNQVIFAVKAVRERTGLGLAEALQLCKEHQGRYRGSNNSNSD